MSLRSSRRAMRSRSLRPVVPLSPSMKSVVMGELSFFFECQWQRPQRRIAAVCFAILMSWRAVFALPAGLIDPFLRDAKSPPPKTLVLAFLLEQEGFKRF